MTKLSTILGLPIAEENDFPADNYPVNVDEPRTLGMETYTIPRFPNALARGLAIPAPVWGMVSWTDQVGVLDCFNGSWVPMPPNIGGQQAATVTFAGGWADLPALTLPDARGKSWKPAATVLETHDAQAFMCTTLNLSSTGFQLRVYNIRDPAYTGARQLTIYWQATAF